MENKCKYCNDIANYTNTECKDCAIGIRYEELTGSDLIGQPIDCIEAFEKLKIQQVNRSKLLGF